jgi:hypothetical protein
MNEKLFLNLKFPQLAVERKIKKISINNSEYMGKLMRFTITGLISILVTGAYGQNPKSVEAVNLYKHTTNSSNLVGPVASEATDSVSVGSTLKYYVDPDPLINTLYTAVLTGSLSSTFNWTTSGAAGGATAAISAVTTPVDQSAFQNYKKVNWTHTGTINLNTVETAVTGGCASGSTTTVPVAIVAVPTVQYSSVLSSVCRTQADGAIGYSLTGLPISWTSPISGAGGRQLKVNITISCTNAGFNGGGTLTSNNVTVTETGAGSGTFDIAGALNYYGAYTITLTAINDRISTKSGVNGTVNVPVAYTFSINLTPVTGPMYHVPNQ